MTKQYFMPNRPVLTTINSSTETSTVHKKLKQLMTTKKERKSNITKTDEHYHPCHNFNPKVLTERVTERIETNLTSFGRKKVVTT